MTRLPRRLVVVGRDAPAWLAALFLQRMLGPAGVQVSVVEMPSLLTAVDVYAALPSLGSLHSLIALDEAPVLTAANGVPMVGQRYVDWGNGSFVQGFDSEEPPGGSISFVQLWAKARLKGMSVPFEEFSYGAIAARSARIPSESDDPQALGATYGYHLDASAYSLLLRTLSERRGITVHRSASVELDLKDDQIRAVELDRGERIEADVFVDATGADGSLISRLPGGDMDTWGAFLPCDRMLTASAPALQPLPGYSQIEAFDSGWIGLFPLHGRTGIVAAFRSGDLTDQQAAFAIQRAAGVPIGSEAVVSSLCPGVRRSSWIGNCVAIGEAAAVLEPLDALQLHMTHVCLAHLVNFYPVVADCAAEAAEYNKVVRLHAFNLRDFQQAHYKLNGRNGERFWDVARAANVSDGLAEKLRIFEARGAAVLYDEETFEAHSWASMFLGHGLNPKGYDPRLDLMGEQDHIQAVQQRLREIGSAMPTLPTIDTFMAATRIPIEAPVAAS